MVGVPADGAGDVEGNLREEGQQGGNLVADYFGGMVVAVIHQRNALFPVEGGVAQGKLSAANGVRLHTDAEHLALDAGLHQLEVVRLAQNLVDAGLVTVAGTFAIRRYVLKAVARPDVHGAGLPQLLGQILTDADAGLAVFHPEFPGLLVGAGKGQWVALGVGEKGGVKVCAQPSCLAEIHPFFEVLQLQPVPVHPRVFLVKNGVGGMEIDLFGAGAEGQHLVHICHQFLRGAGTTGVVAGGLDAAGQGLGGVGIKATDVISLPAVQRNGQGL